MSFKPETVTEGVIPICAPVYVSGDIASTVTVKVSALVSVDVPAVDVAVSKLLPRLIVAVKEHVPDDLTAVTVELETVQESVVVVAKVMVPSPEPAEGVAVTVLVSPNLIGEPGGVIERVLDARFTANAAVTTVTAV